MLIIERLSEYGVKVNEGVERCCGDKTFYLGLVEDALKDLSIERLKGEIMDASDTAFATAHMLKGIYGNLAIEPLYTPMCELTKKLRCGEIGDSISILEEIILKNKELRKLADME